MWTKIFRMDIMNPNDEKFHLENFQLIFLLHTLNSGLYLYPSFFEKE